MKQFFLTCIAIFGMLFMTNAQNGPKPKNVNKPAKVTTEQKATRNADSLKAVMKLSPEQYAQVVKINTDYINQKNVLKSQMKANMAKDSSFVKGQGKPKSGFGQEMKQLSKERIAKIKAIVTPEQFTQWQDWKKAKKAISNPKMDKVYKTRPDLKQKFEDANPAKAAEEDDESEGL